MLSGCAVLLLSVRVGAWWVEVNSLPACIEGEHSRAVRILSVESRSDGRMRVDGRIVPPHDKACPALQGRAVRLTWYPDQLSRDTPPGSGDIWRLTVRLKLPWGTRNPGGFDFGLWLHGKGYVATGWIRSAVRIASGGRSSAAPGAAGGLAYEGLLRALVLGERTGVSDDQWTLFRSTGTVHLMVVSGLHVGVLAGLMYVIGSAVFRISNLAGLGINSIHGGLLCSLLGVAGMVWMSGANPPVVRAGLMTAVVVCWRVWLRRLSWWHGLFWVAWAALMMQPRILLLHGFWLSYGAVLILMFTMAGRWRSYTYVRGMFKVQWGLTLGMAPLIGYFVGSVPLISPLANVLTVPVISLLALPAGLAGWMLNTVLPWPEPGAWFLKSADLALAVALAMLHFLDALVPHDFIGIGHFSLGRAILGAASFIVLALPLSRPKKMIGLLGWMTLCLPNQHGLQHGEFRVTVLDVGQGSAAIVDTQRTRMLVDTGARFDSGFSMAEAVVMPAVMRTGPGRVHELLISHDDNDHAGGVEEVTRRWPRLRRLDCAGAGRWHRDGVRFQTLQIQAPRSRNDGSCTLLVTSAVASAYLSGDIGVDAEAQLIGRLSGQLPNGVDLLTAPHHGSNTSSSVVFVRRLRPRHVVVSAGRSNRYGHPHRAVLDRYRDVGSSIHLTSEAGAVTWTSRHPQWVRRARRGR